MTTPAERINEYRQKREKILQMGGAEAIEKRHTACQWTAREKLDYLFDFGIFTEIGLFITVQDCPGYLIGSDQDWSELPLRKTRKKEG